MLARFNRRIKQRFPSVHILVRGDSGFWLPQILEALESLDSTYGDVDYLLGIARNNVLVRHAETAMEQADETYEASRHTVKHFTDFQYAAGSWNHPRLVITKVEYRGPGSNPRLVITSRG